jgi:hypothetical protein
MTNDFAFPYTGQTTNLGLTKREYFAALIAQGMVSNSPVSTFSDPTGVKVLVKRSFMIADEILSQTK